MFWLWELPSRGKFRHYQNNTQVWQPWGASEEQGEAWTGNWRLVLREPAVCSSSSAVLDAACRGQHTKGRPASSGSGALKVHPRSGPPGRLRCPTPHPGASAWGALLHIPTALQTTPVPDASLWGSTCKSPTRFWVTSKQIIWSQIKLQNILAQGTGSINVWRMSIFVNQ